MKSRAPARGQPGFSPENLLAAEDRAANRCHRGTPVRARVERFHALASGIAACLPESPDAIGHAYWVVFLITTAAIGYGVGRSPAAGVIGLNAADTDSFTACFGRQIDHPQST